MKNFSFRSRIIQFVLCVACLLFIVSVTHATDKLVVKDSAGANTVFDVTDSGQVTTTGKVGVGTNTPGQALSIVGNVGAISSGTYVGAFGPSDVRNASFSRNAYYDGSFWQRFDTSSYVVLDQQYGDATVGSFQIYTAAPAANPISNWVKQFEVNTNGTTFINGNLGIGVSTPTHLIQLSGGAYSDGTTWVNASSRALKENINTLSSDAALKTLDGLTSVTFNYKTDAEDKHVGFIAEDVPDLVATKDRKGLSAMDIVAVLTKVVQEQRKMMETMQEKIDRLEKQVKTQW